MPGGVAALVSAAGVSGLSFVHVSLTYKKNKNAGRPKHHEDTAPVKDTAFPDRDTDPGRGTAVRKSKLGGEPRDI